MADLPSSTASAMLQPPRKSIELEDPGAHSLGTIPSRSSFLESSPCTVLIHNSDTSENEEDIFSDAREGHGSSSGANSPIPITRVEKVYRVIAVIIREVLLTLIPGR